jgi:uncharacterized membrane protein YeaQ/YmgE (transglycosylase-associated protein family)
MPPHTLLLWLVIGLTAGWLASAVVGGGFGLVGHIVIGVLGLYPRPLPSTIFVAVVAVVGAVVLLLVLRLIRRGLSL